MLKINLILIQKIDDANLKSALWTFISLIRTHCKNYIVLALTSKYTRYFWIQSAKQINKTLEI